VHARAEHAAQAGDGLRDPRLVEPREEIRPILAEFEPLPASHLSLV
jgi:hypothetical protein